MNTQSPLFKKRQNPCFLGAIVFQSVVELMDVEDKDEDEDEEEDDEESDDVIEVTELKAPEMLLCTCRADSSRGLKISIMIQPGANSKASKNSAL